VYVYDLNEMQLVTTCLGNNAESSCVMFTENEEQVVAGYVDGFVRAYKNQKIGVQAFPLWELVNAHKGPVSSLYVD
jgi:hypothetical protein